MSRDAGSAPIHAPRQATIRHSTGRLRRLLERVRADGLPDLAAEWLDPILTLAERVDRRRRRIRLVRADGILGVEMVRHRGRPVTLRDGTVIRPGDPVAVIHFRNERVSGLAVPGWQGEAWRVVHLDLAALARWWRAAPQGDRPVALRATTILGPFARRAGWEIHPRTPSWRTALDDWFMRWLLAHWRRDGRKRLAASRRLRSVDAWLSCRELGEGNPG